MKNSSKSFLVIGLGAIGSIVAAGLIKDGHDLLALMHNKKSAAALNQCSLKISGVRTFETAMPPIFASPAELIAAGHRFDYILICTKALANDELAQTISPLLKEHGIVAIMQNGLNNEKPFIKALGGERVLRAVLNFAGITLEPGAIKMTYQTESYLGPAGGGESAAAQELSTILTASGLKMRAVTAISHYVWEKSLNGIPISAISALTGLTIGEVLNSRHTAPLAMALLQEMLLVAAACGEEFPPDFAEKFINYNKMAAAHIPSMRGDIAAGRVSEARYTIGEVAALGEKMALMVPKSRLLASLLLAIDEHNGLAAQAAAK